MVGSVLDPARHRCLSGPAAWRVVLEATILRWIVRRRDDNAVCQSCRPPKIVERENGVRDCRRRRIAIIAIDHGLHAIGREHLEGGRESWLGQRVRVFSDIERPADALAAAVVADRLRHRENVVSLNELSMEEPRWPLVPKATRCARSEKSGLRA